MSWADVQVLTVPPGQSRPTQQAQQTSVLFSTVFCQEAANAYTVSNRAAKTLELLQSWSDREAQLQRIWDETSRLFAPSGVAGQKRANLHDVLEQTMFGGRIYILDLNPSAMKMSQPFKLYLMDFVFRRLRQLSYIHYRQSKPGNCLIVLDEAGRYVPQDVGDDHVLRNLCKGLTDSVKEMRKMRCGFLFITQTVAEIQKEIYRNLHFRIYGVGLGVGVDADHIRAREGDEAFELYRSLPDPRLSGTYSFMVGGVLLAIGSSGRPMVIEGFPSSKAVLDANPHLLLPAARGTLSGL